MNATYKQMRSRVLFFQQEDGTLIGFVHIATNGYIYGVAENDPRPKIPVFPHKAIEHEIQPGRIYMVDIKRNAKCFIASNPNPRICNSKVELEGNVVSVTIGKSTLVWNKEKPRNKPSVFLSYCVNRKELKNPDDVFTQITEAFDKLGVDYTA